MAAVIGTDRLDGGRGTLHVGERQQSAAGRQAPLEAGGLYQRRAAAGEVGGGAVAEPAGAAVDVRALGNADLAARAGDVVAVAGQVRLAGGAADVPAAAAQQTDDFV